MPEKTRWQRGASVEMNKNIIFFEKKKEIFSKNYSNFILLLEEWVSLAFLQLATKKVKQIQYK